jgi:diketogulonate reductase-like aldo/keto reductase
MDRRRFLSLAAAWGTSLSLPQQIARAADARLLERRIPSSGEAIPILGMGSWITFNVGDNERERAIRVKVLEEFFSGGGGMIDSSPMYGSSETVIGYCLSQLPQQERLFAATKVWTRTKTLGLLQMKNSERLWGVKPLDLIHVHNLLDWQTHLETLNEWKADGRLRYTGITTSHGRRHEAFASVMAKEALDFVQFTYNVEDREAEKRLLPLAAERGMAVVINRPFQRGALIAKLKGKPLPALAAEIGCKTWPQFLLKFIISHPAVTCAIPATSNPAHMRENLEAGRGVMPDAAMRRRMADYVRDF